jgi:multiple sugar transport system ATP-binding protein
MAELKIDNVYKSFGEEHILKGINLDIVDGEFVILVGPSGCGKSTLLNCIAGLEVVTTGDVILGDNDITYAAPKDRNIAMVFQSYALYPNMNVRKNIAFGLEIRKMPKTEIAAEVDRVAKLLQIEPLLDRKPSQLSGGQRQRVAMGRALARRPKIYLFDEPLSNLDAKLRVEMRTEMKKLHQRLGTTIVYVTHDQIEAMTLADRIAVMKGGVVQQFGTPQEVYDNPANIFVAGFMGSPSMNFLRCEVVRSDNDYAVQLESQGKKFDLPVDPQQADLSAHLGKSVMLGIRPEQITHVMQHLVSEQYITQISVKIEVTEPTGADTLVLARINDQECECRVHPQEVGKVGDSMDMLFNMSKAVFFDEATEARL